MKAVACGKFRRHAQNWQKAYDQENRILWPLFGQNFFFKPGKAENVSQVLVLVADLFTFQVPDVSNDVTIEIWLGTRQKLAHANTAQMALSMCSSRYCSTFAPLFFLFFWTVVFLRNFNFYFLFFWYFFFT